MIVSVVIDPRHAFAWHLRLVSRLRAAGHVVQLARGPASPPWPVSVQLILDLEALVYRRARQTLSARTKIADVDGAAGKGRPDLVLDLTTRPIGEDDPAFRLLYDGAPDPALAVAALLDGATPRVDLVQRGVLWASGRPANENPASLGAGLDAIAARVLDLCGQVVARAARAGASGAPPSLDGGEDRPLRRFGGVAAARFALATLGSKAAARLRTRVTHPERWRVGYRLLDGPSVWDTMVVPARYSWLPDDGGRYFADPFPIVHEGRTWIFCEEYPYATGKGILSVFEVAADGTAGTPRPILETGGHLSYPFVFASAGTWWMIPESSSAGEIALYRATEFPWRWTRERALVACVAASDATLVTWGGRLWLFATLTGEAGGSSWDALALFHAPDLFGAFLPHPLNPVLVDAAAARPAGRMLDRAGTLMRVAQDCRGGYGAGLTVARVDRLDPESYRQTVTAVLPPPPAWGAAGFHTLNQNSSTEAVDCLYPAERH